MRRSLFLFSTLAATVLTLLLGQASGRAAQDAGAKAIKCLIITGDHGHAWKDTTPLLRNFLSEGGKIQVDTTETPAKDLTSENLARYDVLLLNYKDTPKGAADTKWSDENKKAFLDAVKGGKGLVVYHFASASFVKPNWEEFENAIAGGWRTQGFHGPAHEFKVKKTDYKSPITTGLSTQAAAFDHVKDELYSNSLLTPGSVVLATAYCDAAKPKGTGKDEAVIWINNYGKGRVFNCALGHDVPALSDKPVQEWMRRGVEWAATGKVESKATQ